MIYQIERMEKTARYFGQTYSSYVRSLDREHWNSLTTDEKEAIKAHSRIDLMFNKLPKHIQALIKDTAKGSNDPNKQMEAVISFLSRMGIHYPNKKDC